MEFGDFIPQPLPPDMPSLAGGAPSAPPGTIFVLAAGGGFAAPRRKFTLHFGRAVDDVHVAVGTGDRFVSRLHGVFACDGDHWWLRNEGKLPIQLPDATLLLRHSEVEIASGYTRLIIESPKRRSHQIDVCVVSAVRPDPEVPDHMRTADDTVYDLSELERLVVTALAQRYLRQERYPQPVSWKQAADDLNRAETTGRLWSVKSAEHVISALRKRLAVGRSPIPGILRDDGIPEPVGNTLNHNLIQALLKSAALMPNDLHLLGDDD